MKVKEPREELQKIYEESVQDVETFTGSNFKEIPDFYEPADNEKTNFDGFYSPYRNMIIIDTEQMEKLQKQKAHNPNEPEYVKEFREAMMSVGEREAITEELLHAKQDQEFGYNFFNFINDQFWGLIGSNKGLSQADYATEGFADFGLSYLTDHSLESTEQQLEATIEFRENFEPGLLSKLPLIGGNMVERGHEHLCERYVGHLFYRSFNEDHSLDETLDLAFDPPHYGDLPEVFDRIEQSDVNYNDSLYEHAENHLREQYL